MLLDVAVAATTAPPASSSGAATTAARRARHIPSRPVPGRGGSDEAAVGLDVARRRAAADARQPDVVVHVWIL
jgi:hypothetical protein